MRATHFTGAFWRHKKDLSLNHRQSLYNLNFQPANMSRRKRMKSSTALEQKKRSLRHDLQINIDTIMPIPSFLVEAGKRFAHQ